MLCPCACAAAQRQGIDIDLPKFTHPRFWICFHPLYNIALANIAMVDYSDAPWSEFLHVDPAGLMVESTTRNSNSDDDVIARSRSEIYDRLGDMGQLSVAQRIAKVRDVFQPVQKLAGQSAQNTKMKCAYLVELEN